MKKKYKNIEEFWGKESCDDFAEKLNKLIIEEEKCKCESYFGDYKCHVPTNVKDSQGRIVYVDKCLKEAVENLNEKGFKTIASCCGHGIIQPSIIIELKK